MTWMLLASVFANVALLVIAAYWSIQKQQSSELAEKNAAGWAAEAKSHQETLNRLKQIEEANTVPLKTAADIVKEAPKRLKLRRSWSDEEARLEAQHNTREKKHLDLVRELENIHYVGVSPKE